MSRFLLHTIPRALRSVTRLSPRQPLVLFTSVTPPLHRAPVSLRQAPVSLRQPFLLSSPYSVRPGRRVEQRRNDPKGNCVVYNVCYDNFHQDNGELLGRFLACVSELRMQLAAGNQIRGIRAIPNVDDKSKHVFITLETMVKSNPIAITLKCRSVNGYIVACRADSGDDWYPIPCENYDWTGRREVGPIAVHEAVSTLYHMFKKPKGKKPTQRTIGKSFQTLILHIIESARFTEIEGFIKAALAEKSGVIELTDRHKLLITSWGKISTLIRKVDAMVASEMEKEKYFNSDKTAKEFGLTLGTISKVIGLINAEGSEKKKK